MGVARWAAVFSGQLLPASLKIQNVLEHWVAQWLSVCLQLRA